MKMTLKEDGKRENKIMRELYVNNKVKGVKANKENRRKQKGTELRGKV